MAWKTPFYQVNLLEFHRQTKLFYKTKANIQVCLWKSPIQNATICPSHLKFLNGLLSSFVF